MIPYIYLLKSFSHQQHTTRLIYWTSLICHPYQDITTASDSAATLWRRWQGSIVSWWRVTGNASCGCRQQKNLNIKDKFSNWLKVHPKESLICKYLPLILYYFFLLCFYFWSDLPLKTNWNFWFVGKSKMVQLLINWFLESWIEELYKQFSQNSKAKFSPN